MRKKLILFAVLLALAGVYLLGREILHWRAVNTPSPRATFADLSGRGDVVYPKGVDDYSESRTRIFHAWNKYWDGDLNGALELFAVEKEQHPAAYYSLAYSSAVIAALPAYDRDLKALQAQLAPGLGTADRDEVYRKIYKLSKDFYDRNGMETEASGPAYGPEFKDAERNLVADEASVANRLMRDWTHYDSCTNEETAGRAAEELDSFLLKFPDSPHKEEIGHLLAYYKSGSAICGHKKTVQ